jgi:serine/threonine protein phosphatase PrpC
LDCGTAHTKKHPIYPDQTTLDYYNPFKKNMKGYLQTDFLIADFMEQQGNIRKHMEDGYICTQFVLGQGQTGYVFGVLDGHSGDGAMKWLRQYIPHYVRTTILHYQCNWEYMCLQMNSEIHRQGITSGSTMSLLIIIDEQPRGYRMCIVNVGDSAIAGSTHLMPHPWKKRCEQCLTTHKQLTTSHDLHDPQERNRVLDHVKIIDNEYISVDGRSGINMTRSFGDFFMGDIVKPIPQVIPIVEPLCFVTMASDGMWDIVTPKELIHMTNKECQQVETNGLNECLMTQRAKKLQHDNYTMGVLFFNTERFTPWIMETISPPLPPAKRRTNQTRP